MASAVEQHRLSEPDVAGVSLEWLEAFIAALQDFPGAEEWTTAEVVARLVCPVTTVRVTAPSLAGQEHHHAGTTREAHVRLLDLVPPQHVGDAHLYIIHAWAGRCLECLRAILRQGRAMHLPYHAAVELTSESAGDEIEGMGPEFPTIYVWLDWVALVQQAWATPPPGTQSSCCGIGTGLQMWGPSSHTVDVVEARDVIVRCCLGALMVLDRNMAILSRAWPLYEAWSAMYFQGEGASGDNATLQLALVADVRPAALLAMRLACQRLDLGRAECTRPEDKQRIISEVKSSSGLKRMQDILGVSLFAGVRSALRWSGKLDDMALFAVLLLQCGEYAQLQHLLHGMPGLADDEATLKDIRAIFQMYDSDGTGELEVEEFVSVLALAGFGQDEARRIFLEVDKDNGGSVGMEEFEIWWIESQRQQAHGVRPAVQLTLGALVANLAAMVGLLERKEMKSSAKLVRQHLDHLESHGIGGSTATETPLPPYCMKGEYMAVADQVVLKVMSGQLRQALKLVLSLLRNNADALALEMPPEKLLPHVASLSRLPATTMRACLAWCMGLVAELLGRNTGRLLEAEHFAREALELASAGMDDEERQSGKLGMLPTSLKRVRNKSEVKSKHQKDRDTIVTSMVRLKYGANSLISHRLIAEASISLSTWMAMSKAPLPAHKIVKTREGVSHKVRTGTAAVEASNGVNQFAAAYLGSSGTGREGNAGQLTREHKLPMALPDLSRALLATYRATRANHPPLVTPAGRGKLRGNAAAGHSAQPPQPPKPRIPDPAAAPPRAAAASPPPGKGGRRSRSPTSPARATQEVKDDEVWDLEVDKIGARLERVMVQHHRARNNWTPQRSLSMQAFYAEAGRSFAMSPGGHRHSTTPLTLVAHLHDHGGSVAHMHHPHGHPHHPGLQHLPPAGFPPRGQLPPALQPQASATVAPPRSLTPNYAGGVALPGMRSQYSVHRSPSPAQPLRSCNSQAGRRSPNPMARTHSPGAHHQALPQQSACAYIMQHAKPGLCALDDPLAQQLATIGLPQQPYEA